MKIHLNQNNNNASFLHKTGNGLAQISCSVFRNFQETLGVLLSDYPLKASNKSANTKKMTNSPMKTTLVSAILMFLTHGTIQTIILMG